MLQKLARLTAVVCALFAAQVYALGLGDINVRSKLNQRFSATIPVLGATAAQLDSFTIRLASPEDFNRAGIDRSDYLSSLKFNVEEVPGGARVVVSSEQIAREPFLNFIVEARSADGKLLREYTVLLDPPTVADNTAPAQAYTPPPAPVVPVAGSGAPGAGTVSGSDTGSAHPDHLAPAEAAQLAAEMPGAKGKAAKPAKAPRQPKQPAAAPAPAAVAEAAPAPAPAPEAAPAPAAPSGSGGTYGPTAPQETFWSIATKLRPGPQVSMDQVLLAIYRANPSAFDKGSFNGLLKGRTLQVPSLADMQETPAVQAKSLVEAWRHGSRPAVVKKNPESVAAAAEPAAASPAPLPKPPKAAKSKPVKPAPPPLPELPPAAPAAAPAPTPAPAKPAAVTPAPQPTPAPAPVPAEPPKSQAQVPQPAAPAPAPAAATPTPAPAAPPAAETPPAAAPGPAEPPKPKPLPPPPPPPASLFDDPMTLVGAGVFVLVIAAFAWFIFRRKKVVLPDFGAKAPPAAGPKKPAPAPAPKAPPPPAAAAPKKPGPPGPPPMPKPQPLNLGDTTSLPDEPPAPVAPPPKAPPPVPAAPPPDFGRTQIGEGPLARTALDDTARMKAADTQAMAPPQRVLQESIPQATPPPIGGGDVDFDLTSQFEAQTLSINLDANDPLSEADFHLAYGLYDEAASLLKQALVKEPNRQDLRQKLAETYFAGGKPVEFQETAEALHGNISPAEWQKIAIMGRQLSPDAALFKGDGTVATPDIDLTLGDSIGPAAMQVIGAAPTAKTDVIDFDFDSELMKAAPPQAKPTAPAAPAGGKADFDLSHFDLSAEPAPADNSIEFNLDELDLSKPSGGGHIASGDEIGTKLDLARVYADMGDNEAARGLLNEVLSTGNAAQKGEAEALIKRLSA